MYKLCLHNFKQTILVYLFSHIFALHFKLQVLNFMYLLLF